MPSRVTKKVKLMSAREKEFEALLKRAAAVVNGKKPRSARRVARRRRKS